MKRSFDPALSRVAMSLYRHLATPAALKSYILLRHGEWDQLATLSVDPRNYLDTVSGAMKLRRDTMAADFLRKHVDLPTSWDKEEVARENFRVAEKQCFSTNWLLKSLAAPLHSDPPNVVKGYVDLVGRIRSICKRVLGPIPDDVELSFGPGTSFEMKGLAFTTLADKMYITPHVTKRCSDIFEHYFWPSSWGRERFRAGLPLPTTCRGNRFTTVPKDGKGDRGICIEPLGNLACQLSIGRHLKRRLAAVGLKVDRHRQPANWLEELTSRRQTDGQVIHRKLALQASITGDNATIDLSNASDTVALELVRLLLPPEWFHLLDAIRSPLTWIKPKGEKGRWVLLDKFSSMGNGFTFELETLIFAAISAAVTGDKIGDGVWVYGDDIIVRSNAAPSVISALEMFGFTPNSKKTYVSGAFRESCGGDFFSGHDVRAVFCKETPANAVVWVALHNRLRQWFASIPQSAAQVLSIIRDQIPVIHRLSGPSDLENVLHTSKIRPVWRNYLEKPRKGPYKGVPDGIRVVKGLRAEVFKLPLDRWSGEMTLTLALLGVPMEGLTPRGDPVGVSVHWYSY